MIFQIVAGLAIGFIAGAVLGYRFAIIQTAKLFSSDLTQTSEILPMMKNLIKAQKKAKHYTQMDDEESEKQDENSSKRHEDLVRINETEDDGE